MIFLLFILSSIILFIAWKVFKLKLLSPTVWASGMFSIYSVIYIATFNTMLSDISVLSVLIIFGFLFVTFLGELCATTFKVGARESHRIGFSDNGKIIISKQKTIILTIIFTVVAVMRFYNLAMLALNKGGGYSNIIEMLSVARIVFVESNRSVVLGNFFFNQIVYMCEISTYVFIFIFMYNFMVHKSRNLYLLLPVVPDLIFRIVTTSRSAFIMLFLAVLIIYILISQNMGRNVFKMPIKLVILFICFVIFFIWYGFARNSLNDTNLVDYLQMYTCSAIYNFDQYLINGWGENPYFGFYTLQGIYEILGIQHSVSVGWDSFLVFSTNGARSNLYTALATTIQDYGIVGMLFIKFVEAFVGTIILKKFSRAKLNSCSFYVLIFFAIAVIYCYLWTPMGNVFVGYYGSPDLMVRYLIYGYILIKFILKPKRVTRQSKNLKMLCLKKNKGERINV